MISQNGMGCKGVRSQWRPNGLRGLSKLKETIQNIPDVLKSSQMSF